jgi:hypothetical protein
MHTIPIASLGATSQPYRDVPGRSPSGAPDGYVYRQYQDGSIVIIRNPKGVTNVRVTSSSNPTAWGAITKQIGAYPSSKLTPEQIALITTSALNATAAALQAVTPRKAHKKAIKELPAPVEVASPPPSPGWVLPLAVGGGALVLFYLFTRKER